MLIAGKKLTKDEEQKVKLSAKNLFKKLTAEKTELLVVDWYKDEQPRAKVKTAIETSLDADLPVSYDKETFAAKINLLLTDDEAIHEMNMRFRGIDRATDVLSFPMLSYPAPGDFSFLEDEENMDADCFDPESGELLLGDIVISTDHCRAQAVSYGHSVEREYAFLIAHSMLHLCGYDHESVQEEKEMFSLQEEILERLGILR